MNIQRDTVEFAANMIPEFHRAGVRWADLRSPVKLCETINFYVSNVQETSLLDIEDVLIELLVRASRHGCKRSLSEMVMEVINRFSKAVKDDSPTFEQLPGTSNDDDRQGQELVEHDMSRVVSPDMGPGSDLHIAILDIQEQLGEDCADNFECQLAGASRRDVERDRGYSYMKVRILEEKAAEFLERGEYTLDSTNRRLGAPRKFESGKVFFKSHKDVVRTWDLPDVDHRSTKYTDISEFDNTPLRPIGEVRITTDVLYSDSTGTAETKIDDRNVTPGVITERCSKLPGFTMNGHTIKDCSRKSVSAVGNTDYDYFKYCDELYSSTVRTREHLL